MIRRLGCFLAVLVASTGTWSAAQPPAVRDSAGIRIIEHQSRGTPPRVVHRVGSQPRTVIGVDAGEPPYELSGVTSALRLAGGTIVVANTRTSELRFFDDAGRHKATIGRRGQGPGEFGSLAWIQRFGPDSVIAYDRTRRVLVFSERGRFERESRIAGPPHGRFADGRLLASLRVTGRPAGGAPWDSSRYFVYSTADWAIADTLGMWPNDDQSPVQVLRRDGGPAIMMPVPFPFGRIVSIHAVGSWIMVGDPSRNELRLHSPDGALRRIIRRAERLVPVTEANVRGYRDSLIAAMPEDARAERARWLETLSMPTTIPAYNRVEVDAIGRIWVEEYRRPGMTRRSWSLYDDGGSYLGDVVAPPDMEVTDMGADFLVGRRRNDLDVEQVVVYDLLPP
jgi:hypothetical protein